MNVSKKLGCEEYYLMAHSISGLYSLFWAKEFPQVLWLDGGHYLHFEYKEEIVDKVNEWIQTK